MTRREVGLVLLLFALLAAGMTWALVLDQRTEEVPSVRHTSR